MTFELFHSLGRHRWLDAGCLRNAAALIANSKFRSITSTTGAASQFFKGPHQLIILNFSPEWLEVGVVQQLVVNMLPVAD